MENDGFDLGAQRREIAENDLPKVREELGEYLGRLRAGESVASDGVAEPREDYTATLGLIAEKEKIATGGEHNLSGERYRESGVRLSHFPIVSLGEVAEVVAGQSPPGKSYNDDGVGMPFYQGKTEFGQMFIGEPTKWTTDPQRFAEGDDILMSVRAPVGPVNFATQRICIGRGLTAIRPMEGHALTTYIFYVLRSLELEVQREIVAEIERYQRVIDGARAVIENYRPQIVVDPEWPMVAIGEVCNLINGRAFKPQDWKPADSGGLPIVRIQNLNTPDSDFNYYTGEVRDRYLINQGQLLFSWSGSRGTSFGAHIWNGGKAILNQHIFKVEFDQIRATKMYLLYALNKAVTEVEQNLHGGVGLVHITKGNLKKIQIPVPSLTTQQAIVAEIEAEQSLVAANRELVERMEGKIRAAIGRVWGRET